MDNRYFIKSVRCGVTGGVACGPVDGTVNTTVNYEKNGVSKWITLSEACGIPGFYLTDEDIYEKLMSGLVDDEFEAFLLEHHITEFDGIELGEYQEIMGSIMSNDDNPACELIYYLILVTRCSNEELESYLELGNGKYADEIEFPEEEDDVIAEMDFSSMDKETLYKTRLFIEAKIECPHVYDEMDGVTEEILLRDLERSKEYSFDDYDEWKEQYIQTQKELLKGTKLVKVSYLFAGIGNYVDIIPEEMIGSFKQWIAGNGSAFMGDIKDVSESEEDIILYIKNNALGE